MSDSLNINSEKNEEIQGYFREAKESVRQISYGAISFKYAIYHLLVEKNAYSVLKFSSEKNMLREISKSSVRHRKTILNYISEVKVAIEIGILPTQISQSSLLILKSHVKKGERKSVYEIALGIADNDKSKITKTITEQAIDIHLKKSSEEIISETESELLEDLDFGSDESEDGVFGWDDVEENYEPESPASRGGIVNKITSKPIKNPPKENNLVLSKSDKIIKKVRNRVFNEYLRKEQQALFELLISDDQIEKDAAKLYRYLSIEQLEEFIDELEAEID